MNLINAIDVDLVVLWDVVVKELKMMKVFVNS